MNLDNSTLVPPTGFSLSEDLDTTPSFVFTEYDQDPKVLSSSCEGLKPPNKVGKIDLETPSYYCSLKRDAGRPREDRVQDHLQDHLHEHLQEDRGPAIFFSKVQAVLSTTRRSLSIAPKEEFNRPTAGGRQLVACPPAKGTLATYHLDSTFDDFLVQF